MADRKLAYDIAAFDVSFPTVSLAGLAADTALLTGVESSPIDNTLSTLRVLDYLVSGRFRVTSTQPRSIEVWAIGSVDGILWPSVFDGINSSETIPSNNIKSQICVFIAAMATDIATDRDYDFGPVSLVGAFRGTIPPKFEFFATHSNTSATNGTAGANYIRLQPVYETLN